MMVKRNSAFGFRIVRRRQRRPLTEEERLVLEIERAFQCGSRYSRRRWRRRTPPRFRRLLPGAAGYAHQLEQRRAFFRGYDAFTRARIAHDKRWAEPWVPSKETAHAA